MDSIILSLEKLIVYIKKEQFKGFDPYDTLNSWIPFRWFGKWSEILAIQFQKRNPINIRPLLGIKKEISTKGAGLLLTGFINVYKNTQDKSLLLDIEKIKEWILSNQSKYQDCYCWGYDYDYTTPLGRSKKGSPTVIHHSYILKSLFYYYQIINNRDEKIEKMLKNSSNFVLKSIPMFHYKDGICFGYNPESFTCCINASIHAAQCLSYEYFFTKDKHLLDLIIQAVNFVVAKQKKNGVWSYSFDLNEDEVSENERMQIDFHQGFVLESLYVIKTIIKYTQDSWENAIKKGIRYYKENQFYEDGRSVWRVPRVFPVDIHNQSQGIITFSLLKDYDNKNLDFANTIAKWTIENMQDRKGFFYYRKFAHYTNKISYMRWSQAWMLIALSSLNKGSK